MERSELRSHLLHSQMGFPLSSKATCRKPGSDCSWAPVQQGNSNRIPLDISWHPYDIKHPDFIIFFFPQGITSAQSLSSLQANLGCSCPQSNKHSALPLLQRLSLDKEQGEPNPRHVGTCAGDRGVQGSRAEVQQLKSCLWYHKYESPKTASRVSKPNTRAHFVAFEIHLAKKAPDSVIYEAVE